MGLQLATVEYNDLGGGLDLKSSPTKVSDIDSSLSLNVDYSTDGAVKTRNGSSITNVTAGIPAQMSGAPRTLALFDYKKSSGTSSQIICAGTTIKTSLTTPVDSVTGLSASVPIPDMEFMVTNDDEYLFWGNGSDTNRKFNGTTWTNWSIAKPSSAATTADGGAGALGAGDYTYYVTFARTVSSVIVQESDLSTVSTTLTLGAARQISITNIPTSSDSQVNARVIYRSSPTSSSVYYRLTTIADNTTTTYTDNTLADGTIRYETDNQAAPVTQVFEEFLGRMYIVDSASKTDLYYSKFGKPWAVPTANIEIFDGPVQCVKRMFGVLIISTDKSLWVLSGDIESNAPSRVSSKIGILNNRCAVGEDLLYILATNKKFYSLTPTDFSESEIRFNNPLSAPIESSFNNISDSALDHVCMEYYTKANESKVLIACPVTIATNNTLLVYNETQSSAKQKPVWQIWDNIKASALRQFSVSSVIDLYSGDYNGFLWKLNDSSLYGDGAAVNGTTTSSTTTTLTDTSQSWTVNAYTGMTVKIISGTGVDQTGVISSNTATTLTVSSAWTTNPNTTSTFTIGGYDTYHYTNWKSILGSYENLKQLWYIWLNANASGSYTITMYMQIDFDSDDTNTTATNIILTAGNALWGSFIWGSAQWGSRAVFLDRNRTFLRFRALRVGWRHRKAGQPWQINTLGLSVQDKGFLYAAAA